MTIYYECCWTIYITDDQLRYHVTSTFESTGFSVVRNSMFSWLLYLKTQTKNIDCQCSTRLRLWVVPYWRTRRRTIAWQNFYIIARRSAWYIKGCQIGRPILLQMVPTVVINYCRNNSWFGFDPKYICRDTRIYI